jgi:hypothetical protein
MGADAADRDSPGPDVSVRGRPLPYANGAPPWVHNVTPEEDYRTALLSDSPNAGVRYRTTVAERQRNDPDAKPACGNPRAERRAAAVVSSLVDWRRSLCREESAHGRERGTAGLQDGSPEARGAWLHHRQGRRPRAPCTGSAG